MDGSFAARCGARWRSRRPLSELFGEGASSFDVFLEVDLGPSKLVDPLESERGLLERTIHRGLVLLVDSTSEDLLVEEALHDGGALSAHLGEADRLARELPVFADAASDLTDAPFADA